MFFKNFQNKMSTKYEAKSTEDYYFNSARNYSVLDNDLEVILLD
jgi:hypothetical protein